LKISAPPKKVNFKVPITVQNRIEGENFDFGYLKLNGIQVNSGFIDTLQVGTIEESILYNVEQVTSDYLYNLKTYFLFKWIYNGITQLSGQSIYSPLNDYFLNYNKEGKIITRDFKTVYPLTIINSLENSTLSADSIFFKDPLTTNTFDAVSAANNGFEKADAFENLNEKINNQPNQKYSVIAKPSFNFQGTNYYWYGGDFNPTTQTDIMITDTTVLKAIYKGTQHSDDTSALASNGQRKIVKTSNGYLHQVYESLGKVWYERSTDNGQTWEIMNGGQPVSVGTAKQPSIDYRNTADGPVIAIVYQSYTTSSANVNLSVFKDGVLQGNTYGFGVYNVSQNLPNPRLRIS